MTWKELLNFGVSQLKNNNISDPEFDAMQLILTFFENSYSNYCMRLSEKVTAGDVDKYSELINNRVNKVPLQYILGKWDFYDSTFFVGEGVLIPRAETEELVEFCIDYIKTNNCKVIYDLCSGSGCIGLSIAKECPDTQCYLFELYQGALFYLNKNLDALGLKNVKIIRCDVLSDVCIDVDKADLIVSNPPYIESGEIPTLQTEVQQEPITALDGGIDGLDFYRAFYNNWTDKLNEHGLFAFECGELQSQDICKIFSDKFLSNVKYDMYGVDRFVILRKI